MVKWMVELFREGERVILRIALQESNTINVKYKTVLFIKAFFAKESDTNN